MTETHATVRAVFRMWTGASEADFEGHLDSVPANIAACSSTRLHPGDTLDAVGIFEVGDNGHLYALPSCPVCGVLLTMAEENRRTE